MRDEAGRGLSLECVSVQFGPVTALQDVSLDITGGERVGLVGLSGAGKTTLLRLFNGMVRPARGRVTTLGQQLDELSHSTLRSLRARVGFVHQDLSLIPNLNVLQNVVAGRLGQVSTSRALLLMTMPPRQVVAEVHEILDRVGIGEKLYQRLDRLSGGQRQRVAIARALFQRPEVLLADEPVSSVDPSTARSVLELLTELAQERGLTLCVSLHHTGLAREFFPRLVGMRAGQIAFDRPTPAVEEEQFQILFHR